MTPARTMALILRARKNDQRAFQRLLWEHEPEIRKLTSRFFISGSERQDIIQEGRIGLWKAVKDFDPAGGLAWRNFANLCCRRHITTAMAAANRKKYDSLNISVSLETPIGTMPTSPATPRLIRRVRSSDQAVFNHRHTPRLHFLSISHPLYLCKNCFRRIQLFSIRLPSPELSSVGAQ